MSSLNVTPTELAVAQANIVFEVEVVVDFVVDVDVIFELVLVTLLLVIPDALISYRFRILSWLH